MLEYQVLPYGGKHELPLRKWPRHYLSGVFQGDNKAEGSELDGICEDFAQACAEHYRDDCDGWESWRDGEREVLLFWNNKEINRVEVHLEYEPSYTCYSQGSENY